MRGAALERRVVREARRLIAEVERGLRRGRDRVDATARAELERGGAALSAALAAGDRATLRAALAPLDELAERHLGGLRRSALREHAEWIAIALVVVVLVRGFVFEAFKIPSSSMIPTLEIGDYVFVDKLRYRWRAPERGEVIVFVNPCQPDKDFIKRVVALAGDTVEVRCDVLYVNGVARPTRLDAEACEFWDRDEITEAWRSEACSRYVEDAAGASYATLHAPDRPRLDRARIQTPGIAARGAIDFPGAGAPDCVPGQDPRPLARRIRSRGTIEGSGTRTAAGGGRSRDACDLRQRYRVPAGHVFVMGDNRAHSADSREWGSVPVENIVGKAIVVWLSRQPTEAGGAGHPLGLRFERMGKLVE